MKYLSRLLVLTIVSTLLCVAASGVFASDDQSHGRSLARWLLFEMRRSEALQERATTMSRSINIKRDVVADLIAERLTIREAAEQFRAANEMMAEENNNMVAPYRVPQTTEEVCGQIAVWVKAQLVANPRQAERIVRRLEKEIASLPSSHETIQ